MRLIYRVFVILRDGIFDMLKVIEEDRADNFAREIVMTMIVMEG